MTRSLDGIVFILYRRLYSLHFRLFSVSKVLFVMSFIAQYCSLSAKARIKGKTASLHNMNFDMGLVRNNGLVRKGRAHQAFASSRTANRKADTPKATRTECCLSHFSTMPSRSYLPFAVSGSVSFRPSQYTGLVPDNRKVSLPFSISCSAFNISLMLAFMKATVKSGGPSEASAVKASNALRFREQKLEGR